LAGYQPIHLSGFDVTRSQDLLRQGLAGKDKACVILDDLSYVMNAVSAKEASKLKSIFTLIRHVLTDANTEQTTKVFLIVNAHFSTAVPPVFKNTNVWIFTKPTSLEQEAMSKIIGRNKKRREELETLFRNVSDIQLKAFKRPEIILNLQKERYSYRWGTKTDPGDGRMMLILFEGRPMVYNSHNTFCDICKHVASPVKVDLDQYRMFTKKEQDAQKRGTQ
jgi:hypothetical protein